MGYRPKYGICELDFSDTGLDGLRIAVRPVPFSVLLDIASATGSQDPEALRHFAATFAYALESWNVEDDDGQPVPADLDGFQSRDPRFVLAVMRTWMASMMGTP